MPLSRTRISTWPSQRARHYRYLSAEVRVFRRVVEQVANNLGEAREVAFDEQPLRGKIHREIVPALDDQRAARLQRPRDERGDFHRIAPQVDRAAGDASDVEQIVDQPCQVQRLPFDDVVRPRDLCIVDLTIAHDLHGVVDRRERIAQLVREDRDEFVLVTVRLGQRGFDATALLHFAR